MFSRNGPVSVADVDAITTCRRFPKDWSLRPWRRPGNRPEIFIPPDFESRIVGPALIDLARSTFANNGAGVDLDTTEKARMAIADYLAGSVHPDEPPIAKPAT